MPHIHTAILRILTLIPHIRTLISAIPIIPRIQFLGSPSRLLQIPVYSLICM